MGNAPEYEITEALRKLEMELRNALASPAPEVSQGTLTMLSQLYWDLMTQKPQ